MQTGVPHPSPLQNFCSSNQIAERAEECNQGHPVEYIITLLNGPHADMQASFITEAVVVAAGYLGYSSLKEEQLKVVTAFLEGRDVFAVLPTGYEKSPMLWLPSPCILQTEQHERFNACIHCRGCHSAVNITFITAAFETRSQPGTYQLDISS